MKIPTLFTIGIILVSLTTHVHAPPRYERDDEASASPAPDTAPGDTAAADDAKPEKRVKPGNYELQPKDVLYFSMFQEEEMESEVRVSSSGEILLPLLGKVRVGGRSVQQAQEHIRERLMKEDFFVDPQVNLIITEYAERRVSVIGQVNMPGIHLIPPEEGMTLSQAISAAGGVTRLANESKIKLTRELPNGKKVTEEYDLDDILEDPNVKDVELRNGDTIMVPESYI